MSPWASSQPRYSWGSSSQNSWEGVWGSSLQQLVHYEASVHMLRGNIHSPLQESLQICKKAAFSVMNTTISFRHCTKIMFRMTLDCTILGIRCNQSNKPCTKKQETSFHQPNPPSTLTPHTHTHTHTQTPGMTQGSRLRVTSPLWVCRTHPRCTETCKNPQRIAQDFQPRAPHTFHVSDLF